jgi:hypothetical protein
MQRALLSNRAGARSRCRYPRRQARIAQSGGCARRDGTVDTTLVALSKLLGQLRATVLGGAAFPIISARAGGRAIGCLNCVRHRACDRREAQSITGWAECDTCACSMRSRCQHRRARRGTILSGVRLYHEQAGKEHPSPLAPLRSTIFHKSNLVKSSGMGGGSNRADSGDAASR